MKGRTHLFILLTLVLGTLAAGCLSPAGGEGESAFERLTRTSANQAMSIVDLPVQSLPATPLEAAWVRDYDKVIVGQVAPSGGFVLVRLASPFGMRERLAVQLVSRTNELLWERPYPDRRLRDGLADIVGGERYIASSVYFADDRGTYYLYTLKGESVQTRVVSGPTVAAVSPDGQHAALHNTKYGQLQIIQLPDRLGPLLRVSTQASVRFLDDETLLIMESNRAYTLDLEGRELSSYSFPGLLSVQVAAAQSGSRLAVTTSAPDAALSVLTRTGAQVWRTSLAAGGTSVPVVSGDRVLVYDVGPNAGVELYDLTSGQVLWRRRLGVGLEGRVCVRKAVLASTGHVFIDFVTTVKGSSSYRERRTLIVLDADGSFLLKAELGENVNVSFAADGKSLVVSTNNTELWGIPKNQLSWYDLGTLLTKAR
ncbi:MAG: PQQ-binding-like beta-propeller repeat protein [Bacillota bacterium]